MPTEYDQIMSRICTLDSVVDESDFGSATDDEVKQLAGLGLPESVLTFYRNYNTEWGIDNIVVIENAASVLEQLDSLTPNCFVRKHGYIAFARTACGDVYCYDLNKQEAGRPRIVLFSHEIDFENMPKEEVAKYAKQVAANPVEFLRMFHEEKIDEEPRYEIDVDEN